MWFTRRGLVALRYVSAASAEPSPALPPSHVRGSLSAGASAASPLTGKSSPDIVPAGASASQARTGPRRMPPDARQRMIKHTVHGIERIIIEIHRPSLRATTLHCEVPPRTHVSAHSVHVVITLFHRPLRKQHKQWQFLSQPALPPPPDRMPGNKAWTTAQMCARLFKTAAAQEIICIYIYKWQRRRFRRSRVVVRVAESPAPPLKPGSWGGLACLLHPALVVEQDVPRSFQTP